MGTAKPSPSVGDTTTCVFVFVCVRVCVCVCVFVCVWKRPRNIEQSERHGYLCGLAELKSFGV